VKQNINKICLTLYLKTQAKSTIVFKEVTLRKKFETTG